MRDLIDYMNMFEKLEKLLEYGWWVNLQDKCLEATLGDCNCPYQKDYDPKDGHGYTEVEYYGELESTLGRLFNKHNEIIGKEDV
jgi:hypothetical protein